MTLLQVRNLTKNYDGIGILNGVNFSLHEGEIKVVMGPSGCGKTTLLRCLNRLVEPSSGEIIFDDKDITAADVDIRQVRQRIGFVFQNFALYRHLSALENVKLGLRKLRGLSDAEATQRAIYELSHVEMQDHQDKYPAHLSGGQQQRVAIARALAMDPAVLFFDEPTSALDPLMAREIANLLNRLHAEKVTILCVTHDVTLAKNLPSDVLFLNHGRVEAEAPISELMQNHASENVRAFFEEKAPNA
jgi:polar amino acid transport system ATP-binding protein